MLNFYLVKAIIKIKKELILIDDKYFEVLEIKEQTLIEKIYTYIKGVLYGK